MGPEFLLMWFSVMRGEDPFTYPDEMDEGKRALALGFMMVLHRLTQRQS